MNNKLFSIILYVLLGISTLVILYFFIVTDFNDLRVNASQTSGVIITFCYILLGIATLAALIFTIVQMMQNIVKALISIGILLAIFGVSYIISGSEEIFDANAIMLADGSTSKISEAGLNMFYILGLGAIGIIIFSEVSKILK